MNVLIIGCGRTGTRLANELDEHGYDVTAIDEKDNKREFLNDSLQDAFFVGDGLDLQLLKEAGVENADAVAILTESDNKNVMIAQLISYEFNLEKIFVRVLDPTREKVFQGFGIHTLCPTRFEKDVLFDLITDETTKTDSINLEGTKVTFKLERPTRKQVGMFCKDIITRNTTMVFGLRKASGKVALYNEELIIEDKDLIIYATV